MLADLLKLLFDGIGTRARQCEQSLVRHVNEIFHRSRGVAVGRQLRLQCEPVSLGGYSAERQMQLWPLGQHRGELFHVARLRCADCRFTCSERHGLEARFARLCRRGSPRTKSYPAAAGRF